VASSERDYRSSHLSKGADYDRDLQVGDFNTYMAEAERRILDRIVPSLFPDGVPRYLDFACGTGRITSQIEQFADESYGIDVSDSMMKQARSRCAKTTFITQDITQSAVEIPEVDLVTAFRFFGNAEDELRSDVLSGLAGLIKRDGYLVLNNHRNPKSLHGRLRHFKGDQIDIDLSPTKLEHLLNQHGFKIRSSHGIGVWLVMHRLYKPRILASPLATALELLSRIPGAAPLCPDAVIVAQRV
jgi:SAM-dependent methyltransferase